MKNLLAKEVIEEIFDKLKENSILQISLEPEIVFNAVEKYSQTVEKTTCDLVFSRVLIKLIGNSCWAFFLGTVQEEYWYIQHRKRGKEVTTLEPINYDKEIAEIADISVVKYSIHPKTVREIKNELPELISGISEEHYFYTNSLIHCNSDGHLLFGGENNNFGRIYNLAETAINEFSVVELPQSEDMDILDERYDEKITYKPKIVQELTDLIIKAMSE